MIYTPYKFYAEYINGINLCIYGFTEEECIEKILDKQEKYGNCICYTGVCDENYVDGEYIGINNFIYE